MSIKSKDFVKIFTGMMDDHDDDLNNNQIDNDAKNLGAKKMLS